MTTPSWTPATGNPDLIRVFAVQAQVDPVEDPATAPAQRLAMLERAALQVRAATVRHGRPDLLVFPMSLGSGLPLGLTPETTTALLPTFPGPEATFLADLARQTGAWVTFGLVGYDSHWPDRWLNTAITFGPDGAPAGDYSQVHGDSQPGLPGATSRVHVEDQVQAVYDDPLLPVMDLPFGRVAMAIGVDAMHPELFRAFVYRGAEVILHLADATPSPQLGAMRNARAARTWENRVYWVTADSAQGGGSEILAWDTRPLAQSQGPGETVVAATLDLRALRVQRSNPRAFNFPITLRPALYVRGYEQAAARGGADRITSLEDAPPPWGVATLQTTIQHIEDVTERDAVIRRNLDESIKLLEYASMTSRVAVLPEYWLQGYERWYTLQDFLQIGIAFDGWEMERLREVAQQYRMYLAGCIWEVDPDWPGGFFNTGFLLDPSGETAIRYRKINCLNLSGALPDTTPGDVHQRYVEMYGEDSLFPVADTPLGRLGVLVSFDVNYPEQARQLALRGAEVILHTTSEVNGTQGAGWQAVRRARAAENLVYWASANIGLNIATRWPACLSDGHSQVIDFEGNVIGHAPMNGEAVFAAQVDIRALRQRRALGPDWLGTTHWDLAAAIYREGHGTPLNCLLDAPLQAKEGTKVLEDVLAAFYERGVYRRP